MLKINNSQAFGSAQPLQKTYLHKQKTSFSGCADNYKGQNKINYASLHKPILKKVSFGQLDPSVIGAVNTGGLADMDNFIPTPKSLIDLAIEKADIQKGDLVLEPSAGQGHIITEIQQQHPDATVHAVELDPHLRQSLISRGFKEGETLVGDNIMTFTPKNQYDKIIMNPPYDSRMDALHVLACFDKCLKPGGRLVAIVARKSLLKPDDPLFKEYKDPSYPRPLTEEFQRLLTDTGKRVKRVEITHLPKGSFMNSDIPFDVETSLIVIDKNSEGSSIVPPPAEKYIHPWKIKPLTAA